MINLYIVEILNSDKKQIIPMKPLYTKDEYENKNILSCECYCCGDSFSVPKKEIKYEIKNNRGSLKYCSFECMGISRRKRKIINCKNCGSSVNKMLKEIKRNKNNFCSKSCSATYNNKNKKYGIRRSKLESYIEDILTNKYKELEIHFNRKDTIGCELDIYLPKLKIAFEINGIFHYKPIFGEDKLLRIQENDDSKIKICKDNKISLHIINTIDQKHFNRNNSSEYIETIISIIDEHLFLIS